MSDKNEELVVLDDEKHLVLDHDYDGIHELNHPLPSWWKGVWALSFIFAIPYFMYYVMMDGPGIREEYKNEMAEVQKVIDAEVAKNNEFSLEKYNAWVAANDGITKGKEVFTDNCMSCHAEGGAGDIGPNMTDKYWINIDGSTEQMYSFVITGNEEMGMPAWGEMLSKEELMSVVSYMQSLKGTSPANPKEPQGKLIE